MEGKRTLEDVGLAHDSVVSNDSPSRIYSPRLPTPDASRASDASSDTRRGPTVSELLSFRPHVTSQTDGRVYGRPSSQEDTAPRSPSYEERRPLLPPLKMVIANAMNSPPETPRTDGASLQPSPREPAVFASTFKPLAFYPNKKARTTDDRPRLQSSTARTSPFTYHREDNTSSAYPDYMRRLSDPSNKRHRRYSMHSNYTSARCLDADKKPYYTFTGRPNSSGVNSSSHFESAHERMSFDRFPISPSSDASYGGRAEVLPYRTAATMHADSRPYALLPAPSPEYEQACTGALRRHAAAADGFRRPSYEHTRSEQHQQQQQQYEEHHCRDSCHTNAGAFFMPPHYDYSQGKSRKRSNLPKQSTEIMKTWFDNNIANPYPSEEQKALFSNATGISMTQVSNWFINHRRRCPELREKRERVRTGGILES